MGSENSKFEASQCLPSADVCPVCVEMFLLKSNVPRLKSTYLENSPTAVFYQWARLHMLYVSSIVLQLGSPAAVSRKLWSKDADPKVQVSQLKRA